MDRRVNAVDLGSMFLLGLLGTGHCLGMCGPLVLAIPAGAGGFVAHLAYQAGRVITYTVVGGIAGGIGAALAAGGAGATLEDVRRIQVAVTLFAAVFMLVFGLVRLGALREPAWLSEASPTRVPGMGRLAAIAARGRHPLAMVGFGLLMGLLPCGLSYGAFARALPAGGVLAGGALVLAFALGTVPGLLLLGGAASKISGRFRRVSDILSSVLLIGMALWLGFKAFRLIS